MPFVALLIANHLGGLHGAFEWAGDDDVNLHLEGEEHARHEHALVLAFFDEGSLGIECWVFARDAGIGVAHQVEIHGVRMGKGLQWPALLTQR